MRNITDTSGLRYDAVRTLYVAKDGNDSNDGTSRSRAFLTIGAAITASIALTPAMGSSVAILVEDVGTYTEDLTVPDYVLIYAGTAAIVGNHTVGDQSLIRAGLLSASSGTMVTKSTGTSSSKIEALVMAGTGSAAGMLCTSGTLRFDIGTISVEDGWGVGSTTTADLRGIINEVVVTGSGYGIGLSAAGTVDVTGNTIQCASASGTAIYVAGGGEVCANLAKVDANGGTALNVASGSTLNMQVSCLIGDKTIDGDVRIDESSSNFAANERSGFIGDSGVAVDDGGNALVPTVDAGTRTFTLTPTASTYTIYSGNVPITITGADSVTWTDVEGIHYFYYPAGSDVLTSSTTFSDSYLYGPDVLVAALYWDATNSEVILDGPLQETHQIQMSGATHLHLHFVIGAQWYSGLALNTITADQSGALDSHAQFGVDTGEIADEDQRFTLPAVGSTTGLTVVYLDGATPNLRQITQTGFSVITDVTAGIGATGRLVYNEFTGGSWQLSTVDNGKFVLCHVFGIGVNGDSTYSIMGENQYDNVSDARAGAHVELANLATAFALEERRPLATVIFQTNNGYTNAVKARIVSTGTGDDYIDFRTLGGLLVGGGGGGVCDHNSLSGRSVAGTHPTLEAPSLSDQVIKLADAGGTYALSITDSADVEVADINSDGDATFNSLTVNSSSSLASASCTSLVSSGKINTSEIESLSGDLVLDAPSGSDVSMQVNGAEVAAIQSALGIQMATGKGINFGDETLGNYDEGSWTPTGNGVTFTYASGAYIRIGNLVFISAVVTFPLTSDTGIAQVQSLPFTSSAFGRGSFVFGYNEASVQLNALIEASATIITFRYLAATITNENVSEGTFYLSGSYNIS